jgi:hypothetical protein
MKTKRGKAIWLCCITAIAVVAGWAVLTLTPVQEGPGAITALANIPNYIALLLCFFAATACVIFRPRHPQK